MAFQAAVCHYFGKETDFDPPTFPTSVFYEKVFRRPPTAERMSFPNPTRRTDRELRNLIMKIIKVSRSVAAGLQGLEKRSRQAPFSGRGCLLRRRKLGAINYFVTGGLRTVTRRSVLWQRLDNK